MSHSASFLLTTFGGKVEDIGPFLLEERLPKGWQPRILDRFGLSILNFSKTIVKIELGIEAELGKSLVAGKIAGKANGSTYVSLVFFTMIRVTHKVTNI